MITYPSPYLSRFFVDVVRVSRICFSSVKVDQTLLSSDHHAMHEILKMCSSSLTETLHPLIESTKVRGIFPEMITWTLDV